MIRLVSLVSLAEEAYDDETCLSLVASCLTRESSPLVFSVTPTFPSLVQRYQAA